MDLRRMEGGAVRAALGAVLLAALAGCGGSATPQRGGGSRQPMRSQQSGSQARGGMSMASGQGSQSQGLTCDASLEGAGACVSDTQVLFCAGGTWWLLACDGLLAGGYCGYDAAGGYVDCYVGE